VLLVVNPTRSYLKTSQPLFGRTLYSSPTI
jgi:hypothetical protein